MSQGTKFNYSEVKVILLDIEGTTTPISFVADKLFPYSKQKLKQFLHDNYEEQQTKQDIEQLIIQYNNEGVSEGSRIDEQSTKDEIIDKIQQYLQKMIDENKKQTNLKSIQGRIWEKGYFDQEILGEVYQDSYECIKNWTQSQNIQVYIYSSGSVWAQKLLFKYSDKGDITPYLSGYFDTNIGYKDQVESYQKILQQVYPHSAPHESSRTNQQTQEVSQSQDKQQTQDVVLQNPENLDPHQNAPNVKLPQQNDTPVLFVTDRLVEAEAASKAGIKPILSIRDGNAPLPDNHPFRTITSFHQIFEQVQPHSETNQSQSQTANPEPQQSSQQQQQQQEQQDQEQQQEQHQGQQQSQQQQSHQQQEQEQQQSHQQQEQEQQQEDLGQSEQNSAKPETPKKEDIVPNGGEIRQLMSQKKENFSQEFRDSARKQQFNELRQLEESKNE